MTPIKRYDYKEIKEICTNIFFNYLVNGESYYSNGYEIDCTSEHPTPIHLIHKEYMDIIKENRAKYELNKEVLVSHSYDKELINLIKRDIDLLEEEYIVFATMNTETQRERYEKTKSVEYARSLVRIPLNKLINSYYDDFFLEVLFYDDVATPNGKFSTYKRLKRSERLEFIRENIEVTHMGLVIDPAGNDYPMATIFLQGEPNREYEKSKYENYTKLLDKKFADFNNLTLAETMEIKNNDLRQFLQSKIDLDKEDMELCAEKYIRGDVYKLYKNYNLKDLPVYYIRYVCPSTGRVYYNELSLRNLELSKYFNKDEYETYLEAWWNITHLGASIEGKPVISC